MSWRWSKDPFSNEKFNVIISKNGNEYSIYKKQRPEIKSPSICSPKIGITMTDEGAGQNYFGEKVEFYGGYSWKIDDILGYIQTE